MKFRQQRLPGTNRLPNRAAQRFSVLGRNVVGKLLTIHLARYFRRKLIQSG